MLFQVIAFAGNRGTDPRLQNDASIQYAAHKHTHMCVSEHSTKWDRHSRTCATHSHLLSGAGSCTPVAASYTHVAKYVFGRMDATTDIDAMTIARPVTE